MKTYKVFEKNSRWYVSFCDFSNKKHQRLLKNCKNEKEAKICASKMDFMKDEEYLIKNLAKDMYLPGSEHLKRLTDFGKKFAPETLYQKRYQLEVMVRQFGECDIRNLKVRDIELFLMKDKHSGSWKNNVIDTFVTIYEETKWKCDNQVKKPQIHRFARNTKKADVFTVDELKILLTPTTWKKYSDFLAFYMIAACGLRNGELRGIKVSRIYWDNRVLLIDGFCKENGFRTNYNKKGSEEDRKIRIAPISDKLLVMLKNYIIETGKTADDYLFYNRTGTKPIEKEYLCNEFKRVLKKTGIYDGIRKLTPHSLRFTFVTFMRSVLEAEQVQHIVGHSTLDMTDYYTRFSFQNEIRGIQDSFSAVNKLF